MFLRSLCILSLAVLVAGFATAEQPFTQPFYRTLSVQSPPLTGNDIVVLQHFLQRLDTVTSLNVTGTYDYPTMTAVLKLQATARLNVTGVVDQATADAALDMLSRDHYVDVQGPLPDGYLYKVVVPVHSNRSIEMMATLYDKRGLSIFTFLTRAEGQNDPNTGAPLNMFSSDGATPTGLMSFDLNSPEDDPTEYGPYPVNRAVLGLEGNAAWLLPNLRNGILMHTGEWPNWNTSMPMPNSHGCIHSWPQSIYTVWQKLVALGVVVHPNTNGQLPYPYKPQGLLVVQQID